MYQELIEIYKNTFPDDNGQDSGYIFRDGTIIDISKPFAPYCHGHEFLAEPALAEWKNEHINDLPMFPRPAIDVIMNELGVIEFTIDNCHLQCVRLPDKTLTVKQKRSLVNIISKILERGLIRVEVLGTSEYAEYNADNNTAEKVMSKIDNYYSTGRLDDII